MKALFDWFEARRDWAVEFMRMVLGGVLIIKGIHFLSNMNELLGLIGLGTSPWVAGTFAHYIVLAHLLGGLFVLAGLLTRVAALFQLPILMGGLYVVLSREGLSADNSNLEYTTVVFMLLVMYLFYGGGRLSVDHLLESRTED